MASRRNKISKFWFIFHIVATICTGGFWLIPLGIWYVMSNSKK